MATHREANQKNAQDPEWQRKHREGIQKRNQDPEWRRNVKKGAQNRAQNPEWRRKNKEAARIRVQNPEYLRKNKDVGHKNSISLEWRRKQKEGAQKLAQDPEWIRKQKEKNQKLAQNPEWQLKNKEGSVGGFWYGNVRYSDRLGYCELWCPDLWHRIDEAQNHQSILSGKTKFDNGGRALSRHHVYWQPKACCEWDEDTQGYYAWINIGTRKHPNRVKYYISGDPNKFVLLTTSEHRLVATDKIKWIKIFEDLIETKLGGICYLPKAD